MSVNEVGEDTPTTHLTEVAYHHIQTPTTTLGEKVRDNDGTVSHESGQKKAQKTSYASIVRTVTSPVHRTAIIVRVSAHSSKQPNASDRPKHPGDSAAAAETKIYWDEELNSKKKTTTPKTTQIFGRYDIEFLCSV